MHINGIAIVLIDKYIKMHTYAHQKACTKMFGM